MLAVEGGQVEAARVLIHNGANVKKADERGWTALAEAGASGRAAMVPVLVLSIIN